MVLLWRGDEALMDWQIQILIRSTPLLMSKFSSHFCKRRTQQRIVILHHGNSTSSPTLRSIDNGPAQDTQRPTTHHQEKPLEERWIRESTRTRIWHLNLQCHIDQSLSAQGHNLSRILHDLEGSFLKDEGRATWNSLLTLQTHKLRLHKYTTQGRERFSQTSTQDTYPTLKSSNLTPINGRQLTKLRPN